MSLCLWIGGWGLSPEQQQQTLSNNWPSVTHKVFYPGELCITKFVECCDQADSLGGYSLGAFLLLRNYAKLPTKPMTLLAPILDFKAEALLGGRVRGARLAILLRWLRRDPVAALNDFYQQGGIQCSVEQPPYSIEDLIWGIEQLQGSSVDYWRWENVRGCIGEADALLNGAFMQQVWPELTILPDAGHDLTELIKETAA
ncbi:hypothetical protein [Cerasicoccus arenae]|uniref:Alpha/beta hydrolase n=1 Tax=Cerasicoccus arenae TaxID=424488 RepID=A0A8J3D8E3_9BACT|nr:hypothetical protein [Cerasicoccus arenae]MBK1859507.1 hypothetical protein [Cerasicoccus arenae]GHB95044.1 hypothetical protein GCM10007047_08290 [Cerasicoccus arenae]